MLRKIKITNFRSFRKEISFSMTPTKERIHRNEQVFLSHCGGSELLRSGVVFGANGSGKSNLIQAIVFAQRLIARGLRPNNPINHNPFKLDRDSMKSPSKFYFEFQTLEKAYSYEFHLTNEAVIFEKLSELNKSSEKVCFIRTTNKETSVEFGAMINRLNKSDLQNITFIGSGTRPNQLFLTETIDRNVDLFESAYKWFTDSIRVFSPQSIGHGIEFKMEDDQRFASFLKKLLSEFDPSIQNISKDFVPADRAKGIPQAVLNEIKAEIDDDGAIFIQNPFDGNRSVVMKKDGELTVLKLYIERKYIGSAGLVTFDLEEESDGIRRLIDLAPLFYELLYSDKPIVAFIDELDRSLHPMATRKLIELFFSRTLESGAKSQVITTTHNSVLFDLELLRKDEIWFVEKSDGASNLKSLQRDFSPRYDKDIRKDYLNGKYGGIQNL